MTTSTAPPTTTDRITPVQHPDLPDLPDLPALPDLGSHDAVDEQLVAPPRIRRRPVGRVALLVAAIALGVLASATTGAFAATKFSDVPDAHPFAKDINWMANNGITKGYDDGTFHPTDPVTRQSASAFIHRYNSEIEMVQTTQQNAYGTWWNHTIECPSGKRAVAGGGMSNGIPIHMSASKPDTVNGKPGWFVRFHSSLQTANESTVWALCIPI